MYSAKPEIIQSVLKCLWLVAVMALLLAYVFNFI